MQVDLLEMGQSFTMHLDLLKESDRRVGCSELMKRKAAGLMRGKVLGGLTISIDELPRYLGRKVNEILGIGVVEDLINGR